MATTAEDEPAYSTNYVRLSQFYWASSNCESEEFVAAAKGYLQNGGKINYAVPVNSLVKSIDPDLLGYTPLHFAVTSSNEIVVKLLLDRRANFTLKSQGGYTPLRLSIENISNRSRRSFDLIGQLKHPIADLLLSAHVKTANPTNSSCKNGISHLHIACMINHAEAVEFFLNSGEPVNQAVNFDSPILPGYTPLHFVARYCCLEAARVLVKHNANINLKDARGMSPLHLLIERNVEAIDAISYYTKDLYLRFQKELNLNELMMNLLLEKQESDNAKCLIIDDVGLSLLHVACTKRTDTHAVESLLEGVVNINAPIDYKSSIFPGYTPLHFAAHFNIQTVVLLLTNKADIAAKDAKGVTPFDICMNRFGPEDIHSILSSIQHLKDIRMSDNRKLLDVVYPMSDPGILEKDDLRFLGQVASSSPLWTGYTMLHLAVTFAKKNKYREEKYHTKFSYPDNPLISREFIDNEKKSKAVVAKYMQYADLTVPDARSGMTALHLAFRLQKKDIVKLLIEKIKADNNLANPRDFGNLSHFHILCAEGCRQIVRAMLRNGIDINSPIISGFDYSRVEEKAVFVKAGSTALHIAVAFHHENIVKLLMQHNADPLARDAEGLTPLHLAFVTGTRFDGELFKTLLDNPLMESANPTTSEGLSHFHVACLANDPSTVEGLLWNGLVDVNASISCRLRDTHADNSEATKSAEYYASQRDCSDDFLPLAPYAGYGPLHFAVMGRGLESVELLLSYEADARIKNSAGSTPLQCLLQHFSGLSEKVAKDIADLLTADSNGSLNETNNGLTRLHLACLSLDKAAAEKILETGAEELDAQLDPDSPIWPGDTPLHLLCRQICQVHSDNSKVKQIVELILSHGANVNLMNAENLSPIHVAYNKSDTENHFGLDVITLMLQSRHVFEANSVNAEGFSHFHMACQRSSDRIVEEYLKRGYALLDHPKDFFAEEEGGFAPLHFAIQNCKAVVEVLLRHGANMATEDCSGSTPLHLAINSGEDWTNAEPILSSGRCDANPRNILGQTPLEMALHNRVEDSAVKFFLKHGALFNVINPLSSEGLLAIALNKNKNVFKLIMENVTDLTEVDPVTGFNAIHNIVSSYDMSDYKSYFLVTNALLYKGCELDHQDIKGRTPLHVAVQTNSSLHAMKALTDLGANINIIDKSGMTPVHYSKTFIQREKKSQPVYSNAFFFLHIAKLNHLGLYVNEQNKSFKLPAKITIKIHTNLYDDELESMKKVEIFTGYSLRDFLTETAVARYCGMSQQKRQSIVNSLKLSVNFPELGCLLKLQYRKALARLKLMEPAKAALEFVLGLGLPHLCLENVIIYLRNEDLTSLIATNTAN